MGESPAQRAEFALLLEELDVDKVPVNFLNPIPGTAMGDRRRLRPLEALHIVAALRVALPDKEILVCGGREVTLRTLQPLLFLAGANGIMTGQYLTTRGQGVERDRLMLEDLGLDAHLPVQKRARKAAVSGSQRRKGKKP
jgi:biotin synthase